MNKASKVFIETLPILFGIPIWLPIVWGYGFVAMKRIGIILKN